MQESFSAVVQDLPRFFAGKLNALTSSLQTAFGNVVDQAVGVQQDLVETSAIATSPEVLEVLLP